MRLVFFLILILPLFAHAAVGPAEKMADSALEERAKYLYQQVRCVVCEGQSIGGSKAEIATAFRAFIRHELKAGKSNQQILFSLQERYGAEVLMKPPFSPATLFLWMAPVIALIGGFLLAVRLYRKAP